MFMPRQVRIKLPEAQDKRKHPHGTTSNEITLDTERPSKRVRIVQKKNELDDAYAAEVVKSLELIFSDYTLHNGNYEWFYERFRDHDCYNDFIHLAALTEHPLISTLKPVPTQKTLFETLQFMPPKSLELSSDKYHVRRRKPLDFTSHLKKDWESCTVYVEPNVIGLSAIPGRVARLLSDCNSTRIVEHVEIGGRAWAFVVFSDIVSDKDTTMKANWPTDWMVITKAEWKRRDAVYQHLIKKCTTQKFASHCLIGKASPEIIQHMLAREKPKVVAKAIAGLPLSRKSQETEYTPGLILYVSNIHPNANKANIKSFLVRSAKRYMKKYEKKTDESSLEFQIQYVDFKSRCGFTNAHVRVKTSNEGDLLVHALERRKRKMTSSDDVKGKKCSSQEKKEKQYVFAAVLAGDRERIYWSQINSAKAGK